MKTLKLDHQLAELVKTGTKTSTFRLFDDKQLSVGDTVQFIDKVDPDDSGTWQVFSEAVINEVTEKRIGSLLPQDFIGHEEYSSIEEMIDTFKQYYGPVVTKDTPIKIVKFSIIANSKRSDIDVVGTTQKTEIKLYTDGGSRGNPGPSALGYVIKTIDDLQLASGSKYLGITTNNQAEYLAVKIGLESCTQFTSNTVQVFLDSQLVANQMNGIYKIKNRELWPIHQAIKQLISAHFKKVTFTYVPRAYNKEADAMVNQELDSRENHIDSVL